jgi:hypothetical protein
MKVLVVCGTDPPVTVRQWVGTEVRSALATISLSEDGTISFDESNVEVGEHTCILPSYAFGHRLVLGDDGAEYFAYDLEILDISTGLRQPLANDPADLKEPEYNNDD